MPSPTQRNLTLAEVAGYAREAFDLGVVAGEPMSGGTFATVWRVRLSDERDVVLKVGPDPEVRLLRYERDMIASEAEYFRMVAGLAPVPEVLSHGDNWLFTSLLPGTTLAGDHDAVREQLGAAVAQIHTVSGPRFGYPGDRPYGTTWPDAFAAIIEALLADAVDWQVYLPVSPQRIRDAVANGTDALAEVSRPTLVHFDLWDGNVLCRDGKLTGLVDGERYFYGDPLIDFVSPVLFRNIEEESGHAFVRGYGRSTGPQIFNVFECQRLGLYRMHLYLLMATEVPSRGIIDPGRIEYVHTHLKRQLEALG